MRYKINPFPAVRVNWKWWVFMPRAVMYHNKIKSLRTLIELWDYTDEEIMIALINWNYRLEFIIEIPKSRLKENLHWQPHRQTPDIDNLFKAFSDTIFYKQKKYNDKQIYKMKAYKYWGDEWEINFYIV